MSKLIIAGFIILCVIAFVIVIVLLKKNKAEQEGNRAPRINPNAVQNRSNVSPIAQVEPEMQAAAEHVPPAKTPTMVAQSFIDQQRYDEAEAELKKGMQLLPNDDEVKLKLLNLYVITHNYDAFQEVFARIIDGGDTNIIKQAESIKAMLDEEQATQSFSSSMQADEPIVVEASNTEDNLDNGLDFAAFTSSNESSTSADEGLALDTGTEQTTDPFELNLEDDGSSDSSEEGLAFDGLSLDDGLSLENDLSTDNNLSTSELSDGLSLDNDSPAELSLGSLESSLEGGLSIAESNQDEFSLSVDETTDDDVIDFDLSLNSEDKQTASDDAPKLEATAGMDAFDLSMDGFETSTESQAKSDIESEIADSLSLDSLEEGVTEADDLQDAGMAFDLSEDTVEKVDESETLSGFEDFSLDIDTSLDTGATAKAPAAEIPVSEASSDEAVTLDISDEFANFDLGITEEVAEPAPVSTESTETASDDALDLSNELSFDDFSLDATSEATEPQEQETQTTSADSMPSSASSAIQPVLEEQVEEEVATVSTEEMVGGVSAPVTDLSRDFDIVNEIDNNQVTLDLATHYLDLGEYDSAKRLLNEVIETGSAEQQAEAESLLSHAG